MKGVRADCRRRRGHRARVLAVRVAQGGGPGLVPPIPAFLAGLMLILLGVYTIRADDAKARRPRPSTPVPRRRGRRTVPSRTPLRASATGNGFQTCRLRSSHERRRRTICCSGSAAQIAALRVRSRAVDRPP